MREGVGERRVLLDPGIGFGKTVEHNLELLRRLDELLTLGRPIVIGTSRKTSSAGSWRKRQRRATRPAWPAAERRATAQWRLPRLMSPRGFPERWRRTCSRSSAGASVFRVHDVAPVREALAVAAATLGERWTARSIPTTPTS